MMFLIMLKEPFQMDWAVASEMSQEQARLRWHHQTGLEPLRSLLRRQAGQIGRTHCPKLDLIAKRRQPVQNLVGPLGCQCFRLTACLLRPFLLPMPDQPA
jgi:hypothetical protein